MVALLLGGCSGSAQHVTRHSAYIARSTMGVTFVEIQQRENAITGSIRSAVLPTHGSQIKLAFGSIQGVARGEDLRIVVNGAFVPKNLALDAKRSSSRLELVFPKSLRGLQRRMTLVPASVAEYQRALDALRLAATKRQGPPVVSVGQRAALRAYQAEITRVEMDLATVRRDSSALTEDVRSLVSATSNESSDLAMEQRFAASAESLSRQAGAVSKDRVCQVANVAAADAKNVADDAQFSAGFIAGLATTVATLRRDEAGLARDEALLRSEKRPPSNRAPLAGATPEEVDRVLTQASTTETEAVRRTNDTIATVNADVRIAFESADQAMATGGCGPPLVLPKPLALFAP